MSKRLHAFVEGRVQGVFYRKNCQMQAKSLSIVGWCRNLSDGRVEVVAEGQIQNLEKLVAWMKVGPKHASVTNVSEQWSEAVGEFSSFDVR
jgi:acylphosphatase